MPTKKQKKAQDINWMKAQVISAHSVVRRASSLLEQYGVKDATLFNNLLVAKISLASALGKWNKVIWNKED